MTIKFEKLKPGMTVYDVQRNTGLDSYRHKWNIWCVYIIEIDTEKRKALASWNGNKPEWMTESRVIKYRAKMPKGE